jgi:lipopolysaccharide transport system permease protein
MFGIAWAVIRPLLMLLVLSVVFGSLRESSTQETARAVLCAVPAWIFVSASASDSIFCLTRNSGIISRVYFPRMIIVLSALSVNLVDLGVGLLLVVGLLLYLGGSLPASVALLPVVCVWLFTLVLGASLWIAALNARFRDLVNIVPFLLYLLLIVSPVGYPLSAIPESSRALFALNPLVGVFEAFRFCLIGQSIPDLGLVLTYSLGATVGFLLSGVYAFTKIEPWINDYL